ncbi:MAG: DegQ family serine endoprotease [Thermodesulfobacteriota bacterium]
MQNPIPRNILRLAAAFLFLLAGLGHAVAAPAPRPMAGAPDSFADLADRLSPTVVNIYTTQTVKVQRSPHDFFFQDENMPEMFRHFFGPQAPFGNQTPQRDLKRTSLGSGVISSADGYIITNNHVVENADAISVRLTTSEEYDAKIIGRDPKTDLALIKIEPKSPLPAVTFGDSEKLRVGDWVVAIGNPFGFEQTVTAGIVSGKGRSLGSGPYENFIQTDASINPGNSGGPLFNLNGEMVGINTAIYSRSGGNIGIGFAIPVNTARNVISQLKEHGAVVRGWLGVMIQQVTPELAKQFQLDRPVGALVGEVSPGGPADRAGIKQGDVIVRYNGKEISQVNSLPTLVSQTPVGSRATVVLIRGGKERTVTVTIAKLDEEQVASGNGDQTSQELGMSVQDLTPDLAKTLGIKEKSGVLVVNVEPGSPAADKGLRRGDLILEVNRKPVRTVAEFAKALAAGKKQNSLLLLMKRNGHTRYVAIRLK